MIFLGQALPRLRTSLKPVGVKRGLFSEVQSKFKKLKRIGKGGYGEVYSAVYNGKPVIVKVSISVPGLLSMAESVGVLQREVRILARLQKFPFVPRLIEVGVNYFVQEDVEGVSVLGLLDKKGLEPREFLSAMVSAGIIASTLHREGIGHGDFEIRNLLLTPHGAVVIDFGLSVSEDEDGVEAFREARERDVMNLLEGVELVIDPGAISQKKVPEGVRSMVSSTLERFRKVLMARDIDDNTAKDISKDLLFALSQLGARAARGRLIDPGLIRVMAV